MTGLRRAVVAGSLVLGAGWSAHGQTLEQGEILRVRVTDRTGAVIPKAYVTLSSSGETGVKSETAADLQGRALLAVREGRYDLAVQSPGFRMAHTNVEVRQGVVGEVAMTLDISGGSVVSPVVEMPPPIAPIASEPLNGMVGGAQDEQATIVPTRPIPVGKAPGMRVKVVQDRPGEKVYAVVFQRGDEVLSGLTDLAIQYKLVDAHFTGIGAASGATLGWLDLGKKLYHRIDVKEQVEVLSMMGDIATLNGKPVVHAHLVLGKHDGSTVGGHLWEMYVNPTLEVFVTANEVKLEKVPDDTSGMKVIDPTR